MWLTCRSKGLYFLDRQKLKQGGVAESELQVSPPKELVQMAQETDGNISPLSFL
jgi:hypothetical protein